MSVGVSGQSNGHSEHPAISADGRFVAFTSFASNLVPGDTNSTEDVFVRDMLTRVTERVSVGSMGQGNDFSGAPAMSGDGRFIAFTSAASNLVRGEANHVLDVFVRDLLTRVTRRVSVGVGGHSNGSSAGAAVSANGRFVAFSSTASNLVNGDTNGTVDGFVRDLQTGVTRRVSVGRYGQGNNRSGADAISGDGRFVVFTSQASNLVPNDTNATDDVFVRDQLAGKTRRVSIGAFGQGNGFATGGTISADGRFVAFDSIATNLVRDDTNAAEDVFVRDLLAGVTRRVSVSTNGQANTDVLESAISADGRSVAFNSSASNLVRADTNATEDVFAWDTPRDKTPPGREPMPLPPALRP